MAQERPYEADLESVSLLKDASIDQIRIEFEKIISSKHAGKGLRMLAKADLMPCVIGELAGKMTKREMEQFAILAENIDKTDTVIDRRLGLFYLCFERKRGIEAAKRLNYEAEIEQKIIDALELLDKIYFLSNPFELKQFISRYGMSRYEYLDDLSKAQRIVYDLNDTKIMGRYHMLNDIRAREEPIFAGDLAIGEDDLVERGITNVEGAAQMLQMLTDVVHKDPRLNTKKDLLAHAEKLSKSKIRTAFRKVHWLK